MTGPFDPNASEQAPDTADSSATPAESASAGKGKGKQGSFSRRHWGKLTLFALVGAPTLAFAIWAAVGLNFVYSSGERAGFVQKISEKGWLCKTWEGEMAISTIPGSMPQLWTFSVRSDSVAHAIEATNGKRIVLTYDEKPWVPTSCFGETDYFVTGVRVVGNAPEPQ